LRDGVAFGAVVDSRRRGSPSGALGLLGWRGCDRKTDDRGSDDWSRARA